jgi:23S rRNA (guanosine2251-2'-O)-methyltransferase
MKEQNRFKSRDHTPPKDQLIMGLHSLTELLRHEPHRLLRVYTCAKSVKERKSEILKDCEKNHIQIDEVSEDQLTKICGSDSHQSFAAQVKGRKFLDIKDFLEGISSQKSSLILLCDQIFDPQNFGALMRCAECFGADGIVWSKNRGTDLTPVVAKSSCGASEWLSLVRVSNLAETISLFQKEGFEVVAAAFELGSKNAFDFPFALKTVIVVGSEGEGVQPLILKKADHLLHIPMSGKIQSLNVAQAASSLLTSYRIKVKGYC